MTIIDAPAIHAAFDMPPQAAVDYLRNKGLQITQNWEDMLDDAHAKAFTVAKVAKLDMLQDIQDQLTQAIETGTTRSVATKSLQDMLVKSGWLAVDKDKSGDKDKIARRLKTIYQTNVQSAYMAGRHNSMLAAKETHPYWRYVAVLDTRVRRSHAVLHDHVFKYSDNAWGVAMPPNGWNCRCRVSPMSKAGIESRGLKVETSNMRVSALIPTSFTDTQPNRY